MNGKRIASLQRRKKHLLRNILLAAAAAAIAFSAYIRLTLPDVSGLRTKNPGTPSLIRQRLARAGKTSKGPVRMEWVAFDRIPPLLKKCILVSEDASFYGHKGIDYEELKVSIKRNIKERQLARGGSTITQQLAKNLYLSTGKSFARKFREFLIARRLEKALSKDRIFHLYLNVIEFGPGIYGVQAAARRWFGKDVDGLTLEEMVRLTAIIPRPLRSDPRENDGWMKFKGPWIADTLKTVGAIGEDDHQALVREFE